MAPKTYMTLLGMFYIFKRAGEWRRRRIWTFWL